MFKITIIGPRTVEGEPSAEVEVPALPRIGDHIEHEAKDIGGDVRHVDFYWPEHGGPLEILVRVL